ncbi:MAG: hypothetical protein BRD52_05395 [Bacteroidetes bacterium SW_4_67_19]|nr:MAG: hypothetical protein BRD52_05395 [Bacteroidetes bacterium SW_4_67_19]
MSASDRMSKRVSGGRVGFWLLMGADRRVMAALLTLTVFAALVGLGALDPVPLSEAMLKSDPAQTLFQGLTGAIITSVTLVVTLSQLVLSQEMGPLGDQRRRMEGAMQFRKDSEDLLDEDVAPPEPSGYLRALISAAETRAERLKERASGDRDADRDLRDYADDLIDNAEKVKGNLEGANFGTFDVLQAALDFNYSWKIYQARTLKDDYGEAFAEHVNDTLEELLSVLRALGPTREHIKTLYFEWTLVDLSRAMIYAALPALIVCIGSLLFVGTPEGFTGATLGVDDALWTVSAAVAISVSPFSILLSYVLRIATVAKRTLAVSTFVLRETDRTADLDE